MLVVAYIGFGNSVCRYHLPYVERRKDTVKVKYIYRRQEDRVGDEERETWYPDITFTTDIDQVMNDPEVNLIVVNTPDQFHVSYTMQALEQIALQMPAIDGVLDHFFLLVIPHRVIQHLIHDI